jgi:hypothetical protein
MTTATEKKAVHLIRRWSGSRADEMPICGESGESWSFTRTAIPRHITCPRCASHPYFKEALEDPFLDTEYKELYI